MKNCNRPSQIEGGGGE
jgi:hypothetical protein